MKGEKAMEFFNLVIKNKLLPTKIDELIPLSFIGTQAVKFYRETINNFDTLKISEEQRKATLKNGQQAGDMLLDIELKIGEIAAAENRAETKKLKGIGTGKATSLPSGKPPKHKRLGLKSKHMQQAQTLYKDHQEAKKTGKKSAVDKIRKQAKEADDIPTKTAAIKEIRLQNEIKRRKKAEGKKSKTRLEYTADQIKYINTLDKCARILPQKPPTDWNEDAFAEAKAKANILIKRLEVFNE